MKHIHSEQFLEDLSSRTHRLRTPQSVTFELSYGCNLRCLHCYNPTHRVLPPELTTEEVFSILDQLADIGVIELHFTGGEPLVRPDAFDIFQHAKRKGFVLYLLSNATRISPPVVDMLQDIGFYSITISLYGATSPTYEKVTGIPDSYEPCLRGLQCLASRALPVIVRMPVMVENAHEVGDARSLVEGMGFKFQYCLDITPRNDGDLSPLAHRISPSEKVRIDNDMIGLRHEASAAEAPCPAATRNFISCACGHNKFAITPYGEMNLCIAFPTPRYDLRKGTVKKGWEVLKKTVDEAKPNEHDECPACPVRPRCRQGRSDAWLETGDMSVCLPHYREWATIEMETYARPKSGRSG